MTPLTPPALSLCARGPFGAYLLRRRLHVVPVVEAPTRPPVTLCRPPQAGRHKPFRILGSLVYQAIRKPCRHPPIGEVSSAPRAREHPQRDGFTGVRDLRMGVQPVIDLEPCHRATSYRITPSRHA